MEGAAVERLNQLPAIYQLKIYQGNWVDAISCVSGYGNGSSSGYGCGNNYGYGFGDGTGNGFGFGDGYGHGYGSGYSRKLNNGLDITDD